MAEDARAETRTHDHIGRIGREQVDSRQRPKEELRGADNRMR